MAGSTSTHWCRLEDFTQHGHQAGFLLRPTIQLFICMVVCCYTLPQAWELKVTCYWLLLYLWARVWQQGSHTLLPPGATGGTSFWLFGGLAGSSCGTGGPNCSLDVLQGLLIQDRKADCISPPLCSKFKATNAHPCCSCRLARSLLSYHHHT